MRWLQINLVYPVEYKMEILMHYKYYLKKLKIHFLMGLSINKILKH